MNGQHDQELETRSARHGEAETLEGDPAPADERPLSPEQLTQALRDARAQADHNWKQLLLARADLENLRRRTERDVESAHKYALERFVRELLPVRDSLELGLAAAEGAEGNKVREGMELTLKVLTAALEKFGVTEVDPKGDRFDPERHQAMATQVADVEPHTVLTVYQKGYLLNDRLIRPALVVVAHPPARQEAGDRA